MEVGSVDTNYNAVTLVAKASQNVRSNNNAVKLVADGAAASNEANVVSMIEGSLVAYNSSGIRQVIKNGGYKVNVLG